jgi:hypothetical protein
MASVILSIFWSASCVYLSRIQPILDKDVEKQYNENQKHADTAQQ